MVWQLPLKIYIRVFRKDFRRFYPFKLGYHTSAIGFAGHSKWSNIRHIKAEKDMEKSGLASYTVKMMMNAIKEGGGVSDPNLNSYLAAEIEKAKIKKVPKTTIEACLKRVKSRSANLQEYFVGMRGPYKTYFVGTVQTQQLSLLRMTLNASVRKFGCLVGDESIALHAFDLQGIVDIRSEQLNLEELEELMIENGAEDVELREDVTDGVEGRMRCERKEHGMIHQRLQSMGKWKEKSFMILNSFVEIIPSNLVSLTEKEMLDIMQIRRKLDSFEEVLDITDNIERNDTS